MQGRYGAAVPHIRSGTKILGGLLRAPDDNVFEQDLARSSKAAYAPTEALVKLLTRLDWQAVLVGTPIQFLFIP